MKTIHYRITDKDARTLCDTRATMRDEILAEDGYAPATCEICLAVAESMSEPEEVEGREAAESMARADTIYPDTRAGVLAYLAEDLEDAESYRLAEAVTVPDGPGVWLVTFASGRSAIVYLGGYPDPMGVVRRHNDFEMEDE